MENSIYDLLDFEDNLSQHEDYYYVMNNYYGTPILNEILLYLDTSFPVWKTNKGVGYWAAEMVHNVLIDCEAMIPEDSEEELQQESKQLLHSILEEAYIRTQDEYKRAYRGYFLEEFQIKFEEELADENLTDERYNFLYDNYLIIQLEKITYNFSDELIFEDDDE